MSAPRLATLAIALSLAAAAGAQNSSPRHLQPSGQASSPAPMPTGKDVADVQRQLLEFLRLSPTLTTVVAHDPSLLSDEAYVIRNNPQLAAFLAAHPEVARNPDFYLFTHMHPDDGAPDEALQRAVWPDVYRDQYRPSAIQEIAHDMVPMLAFACFLAAVIWAMRLFLENRRWSRIFKMQSDVHSRLIEKFSTTQELAAYMETDAGKRFLEAAPISMGAEKGAPVPNTVARVLTPLQVGIVLVLLGIGFLLLRNAGPDFEIPMRVLGVLILMPGIGFILSAGATWVLAARLGLMPPANRANSDGTFSERQ